MDEPLHRPLPHPFIHTGVIYSLLLFLLYVIETVACTNLQQILIIKYCDES